ncbi:MAG TPA: hypothetical protein DCY88_07835 [Cyanobacteria bacterium UBA11372]|nr:hypothetical protein [Cyanobacteria bacterium UBA11372]
MSKRYTSEADAIRSSNARKGFIYGKDTATASPDLSVSHVTANKDGADENIGQEEENLLTFSKDQLQQMIVGAVKAETKKYENLLKQKDDAIATVEAKLEQERLKSEQEKDTLEKKVRSEQKQKDTITKLLSDFGYGGDSNNSVYIAPLSMRQQELSPRDALREFNKLYDDDSKIKASSVINPETSETHLQFDSRPLRKFIKSNRGALRDSVESELRKYRFLQGQGSSGRDAPTSLSSLPPMLQTYLSEVARIEHSSRYVLWQFVNRAISSGIPPGQTTTVFRVRNLEPGTNSGDWQLDPSVDITTEKQPLQGNGVPIVIRENGMGKDVTPVKLAPVAIPEFWMAHSLIDLERALQDRLGENYHCFEDIAVLEMLLATTAVVYNNGGDVVTLPADVAANGGGQISEDFLASLYAYADMLKIPTFRDGKYAYICPSPHLGQLRKSMKKNNSYFDSNNVEEVTSVLTRSTSNEDMGRVSGYVGTVDGFHIFSGNSFSRGIVGTPGVQQETFGGGSRLTRSGFLVGASTMAWSTAMPMTIREEIGRFGRMREFAWKSHEGWGPLDVDPNSTTPANDQQLGVLEVRASDRVV